MAQIDMFSDFEDITPQQAALWLEGANLHNRPLNMKRAEALAEAIKRGEWAVNGDAVRFCANGQLLDGQHRLQAIVIAGKTVKSLVVRGLASGTFSTIDTNRKVRTPRDVMALAGVQYYSIVSAFSASIHYYETLGQPFNAGSDKVPTAEQLLVIAQRPAVQRAAADMAYRRWCRKFIGTGLSAFCLYVFREYRPDHAAAFFDKLESGFGLEEGSPIAALRDRLMLELQPGLQMKPLMRVALVFKAWRLYLLGADVKQLKVTFVPGQPNRVHFTMDGTPYEAARQTTDKR